MKTSQPDLVLVDATTDCQTWSTLEEEYKDAWVLAVGPKSKLKATLPDEELSEEDIELLLKHASVFLADSDRYKSLAEAAGVRFFKVE